ncbi:MAG: hypothetical protein ACT6RF_18435 [Allorhizobium sp.]|uniref:hypothetical protein n=1 Tax=Allorhizobium sp. TaxID=633478 RepID=UPI004034AE6B
MAKARFTSRLTDRLKKLKRLESAASSLREREAKGRSVYRDRRDLRAPWYRMHIRRMRELSVAAGIFIALIVHEIFGGNLTITVVVCAAAALLLFEWRRHERAKRDQHFD